MNPSWVPAIAVVVGIIVQLGMSYQTLLELRQKNSEQDLRLDGHDASINRLEIESERQKAWRDGYAEGRARRDSGI